MTKRELINYIKEHIDLKDPVITASFKNFRVTILGEVKNPGTYNMPSEKTSLLQALGMAGDLGVAAKRNNLILMREENGVQKQYRIDLRNSDLFTSPYYYLQQNDVIYVPPKPSRVASGTSAIWSLLISSISVALTVVAIIVK